MNSSISTVCTLSTVLSGKCLACLPLDTHCLGEKQRAGATVSAGQSPWPSWHSTTTALHLDDSVCSACRMHRWRESKVPKNSKDTQHIFVCEQKATGQHLLVAKKMSGLQLKLNLTFYKGVKTET